MNLFYPVFKVITYVGLRLFYRPFRVYSRPQIHSNQSIIYVANHQNSFLDALIVGSTARHTLAILIRADIFKFRFAHPLFRALNFIPVFRLRDGLRTVTRNQESFELALQALTDQKALLLFPEGTHHRNSSLRPFTKGFLRIASLAALHNTHREVLIVPVALVYKNFDRCAVPMEIHYLQGVRYQTNGDSEEYHKELAEEIRIKIENKINTVYSNYEKTKNSKPSGFASLFKFLFYPIYFIFNKLIVKVKDPIFTASLKFAIGLLILPMYIVLVSTLVGLMLHSLTIFYITFIILTVFTFLKLKF